MHTTKRARFLFLISTFCLIFSFTPKVFASSSAELLGHIDAGTFYFDTPSSLTNYTQTIYHGQYPNTSSLYTTSSVHEGPLPQETLACGQICGSHDGEYYWFHLHADQGDYVFQVHRIGTEQEWEVTSPLSLVPDEIIASQLNSTDQHFYTENSVLNNTVTVDAYQSLGTNLSGSLYSVSFFPVATDADPNLVNEDADSTVLVYECSSNPETTLDGCAPVSVNGSANLSQDGISAHAFSEVYNPAGAGYVHTFFFNGYQSYTLNPAKYYYLELKVEDTRGVLNNVSIAASAIDAYTSGTLGRAGFTDVYNGLLDVYFSINGSTTSPPVSSAPSAEKAITSFSFQSLTPAGNGVIDDANHTIHINLPFGTDVTALAPMIAVSTGASVSPATNIAQDFTNPINYRVTAADTSTQNYIVAVSVAKHIPVIIVPGLLGTEISKPAENGPEKLWIDLAHNLTDIGDEFMNPLQFNNDLTPTDTSLTVGDLIKKVVITVQGRDLKSFDYTGSLVEEFQNQEYVEGIDLFLFPYDWRYGVSENNVNKLKQKITDVLAQTGATKVDIVAHSTGGLIVKKYVMENPSNNNIGKALFVGVPNTGAPKAIKVFIQGDNFGNFLLADGEMKKIAQNLPVAYDLSPSAQYFNTKGSYVKIVDSFLLQAQPDQKDLNFDEANNFLINDHSLNAQALANAHNLHAAEFDGYDMRNAGVDLYAIDGCKAGTIGKFVEQRVHLPLTDSYSSLYHVEDIPGDGTVPLESATNLPINDANKYYALQGKHGEMLSDNGIRQEIVNLISGSTLSTKDAKGNDVITQDISQCHLDGRAISIYSPLSIDVIDQDGNHAGFASDGVSIENNIPNADFEILGEHKFVYLPTDQGQTYIISVAGTGTGTFTITDATISHNSITQTQVFSNISVTPSLLGHINLSNNTNTSLTLDTNGDGSVDHTLNPSQVLDAAHSENFMPERPHDNPPAQNDAPSGSYGGGKLTPPVVSEASVVNQKLDNQPLITPVVSQEVPTEITAEAPIIKHKNTPLVIAPRKKVKNTKIIPAPTITQITQNPPKETLLTANAVDTKVPTGSKIILGGLLGILLLLLF